MVWSSTNTFHIYSEFHLCSAWTRFFLGSVFWRNDDDVFHVVENVGGCFMKDWFLFRWTENRMICYLDEEISTFFSQSQVNVKLNDNGIKWSDCSCWLTQNQKTEISKRWNRLKCSKCYLSQEKSSIERQGNRKHPNKYSNPWRWMRDAASKTVQFIAEDDPISNEVLKLTMFA